MLRTHECVRRSAAWALQGTTLQTLLAFVNVEKYPPSLLYLLLTLGAAFLCWSRFESARGKFSEVLRTFGRVPLFFYVLHIAARASRRRHRRAGDGIRHGVLSDDSHESPAAAGASDCRSCISRGSLVLALLYPACRWFAAGEAAARRLVAVLSVEPYALAAPSREQGSAAVTTLNHQFRLAARPVGLPKRSDWNYTEEPVRAPNDGEVLVKIAYLSLDPAMRGWMNDGKSYIPPVQIGEVMRAGGVGEVLESRHPGFSDGDHVYGTLGIQEYATVDGKALTKVDARLAPLPVYLGTLGMPGMTAYFGLLDVGKPQAGPDGRRLRRGRRGRHGRRTDREDQRLSRRRHRRRRARSATTSCASSASTPRSTTSPRT